MIQEAKSYYGKKTMRIGICDDQKQIGEYIRVVVQVTMDVLQLKNQIFVFTNPLELIALEERLDILFLDIEMPQMDGLTAAARMNEKCKDIKIIYLTSHDEYMQEAFKVKAFRYLFKSCAAEEITEALLEAVRELSDSGGVLIEVNQKVSMIPYKEIYYIESLGDDIALCVKEERVCLKKTLCSMQQQLNKTFFQCHKSYVVNLLQIHKISEKEIILENGERIPVSVRKKTALKTAYHDYIRENARYL